MKCNGVFAGGGVRGIGHVGAVSVFEKRGYFFENLVGTSAGAIVAALLAVGYKSDELFKIMKNMDYKKLRQETFLSRFGVLGSFISLISGYGIYKTSWFEEWLSTLLEKKNITKFKDLKYKEKGKTKYKLLVTACDVTTQRLLILPYDAEIFGINPDEMDIAKAVCMSMSIPFFYKPVVLKDKNKRIHHIADGGLIYNYPLYLADEGYDNPAIPTFGFKFINPKGILKKNTKEIKNFIEYCKANGEIVLNAQDNPYVSQLNGDMERTVFTSVNICPDGKEKTLGATDFDLTPKECELMYVNGVEGAERFLKNWDFNKWKNTYRS